MKKIYYDCFYGIYGIKFIYINNYSDPVIVWRGYYFNYYDIETALYNEYCENYNLKDDDSTRDSFAKYLFNNSNYVKSYLKDCIYGGYKYRSYSALVASY